MLKNVLDYLLSAVAELPIAKKVLPYFKQWELSTRSFLIRHPIVLFGALLLVLICVLLPITPSPRCYLVKLDALATKDGDQLVDDGGRLCEPRSIDVYKRQTWDGVWI